MRIIQDYWIRIFNMNYNKDKADELTLALLYTLASPIHGGGANAWPGFNPEILEHMFGRGLIEDPKKRVTSIHLTARGYALAGEIFLRELAGDSD